VALQSREKIKSFEKFQGFFAKRQMPVPKTLSPPQQASRERENLLVAKSNKQKQQHSQSQRDKTKYLSA
jgi:hypothetical protein